MRLKLALSLSAILVLGAVTVGVAISAGVIGPVMGPATSIKQRHSWAITTATRTRT